MNIFGIIERHLRTILTPVTKNILELSYFINYGNTLENSKDFTLLNKLLESNNVGQLWNEDDLTLEALLRMLVLIVDYFQNHKFFFSNSIVRIPYTFNDKLNFNINFNASDKTFELLNKFPIQLDGFCSIKFDLEFSFIIEQLINFEVNSAFEGLSSDIQLNAPPIYRQTSLVLHNLCKNEIKIMEHSIIGKFVINSLQSKCIFVPTSVDISMFNEYHANINDLRTFETRSTLSDKLTTLLQLKNDQTQQDQIDGLNSNIQRP